MSYRIERKRKKAMKRAYENLFIGVLLHQHPEYTKRRARKVLKLASILICSPRGSRLLRFGSQKLQEAKP